MIGSAFRNIILFVLALSLSTLVWVVAQVEQNPETRDAISGVPVQVRNTPRGLELSHIDQTTVSLYVSAPQNVWSRLDARSFNAWVDLTGLGAGSHDVEINVSSNERYARVLRPTPMRLNVQLESLDQKVVPITINILDNPPSGFSLGNAVVTPTQVLISGRHSVVEQITEAAALVRVEGARTDFTRIARPVLRDGRGSEVRDQVTITPDTVEVSVPVFQLLSYKTVAVRAIITGTVAPGYQVTNIVVEPQAVTLGGDPRVLENIAYLDTAPVDVSGANREVTQQVRFTVPPETAVDRRSDVFVKVTVVPIAGSEIIRRPVFFANLAKGLAIVSPVAANVDIELAGNMADLAALTITPITVTIDMTGEVAGAMEKTPYISGLPISLRVVRMRPEKFVVVVEKAPATSLLAPSRDEVLPALRAGSPPDRTLLDERYAAVAAPGSVRAPMRYDYVC